VRLKLARFACGWLFAVSSSIWLLIVHLWLKRMVWHVVLAYARCPVCPPRFTVLVVRLVGKAPGYPVVVTVILLKRHYPGWHAQFAAYALLYWVVVAKSITGRKIQPHWLFIDYTRALVGRPMRSGYCPVIVGCAAVLGLVPVPVICGIRLLTPVGFC